MEALVVAVTDAVEHYDLRGLKCPLPVLKARRKLSEMTTGALLSVATSDPMAVIDIPHFCREDGHQLVSQQAQENGHLFLIRKGA